jgi:RNA polymerase sigma-70 factor, ECF subfamily
MITMSERPVAADKIDFLHATVSRPLLAYVAKLTLGDQRMAEDIVQETFVRAWRYLVRHADVEVEAFRPWLYTVARRLVIDLLRARRSRPAEVIVEDLTRVADTGDDIATMLRATSVRGALLALRPEHRSVLIELYYHGRSTVEVASRLGVPVGTVKSRSHYAKQALRASLDG